MACSERNGTSSTVRVRKHKAVFLGKKGGKYNALHCKGYVPECILILFVKQKKTLSRLYVMLSGLRNINYLYLHADWIRIIDSCFLIQDMIDVCAIQSQCLPNLYIYALYGIFHKITALLLECRHSFNKTPWQCVHSLLPTRYPSWNNIIFTWAHRMS